MSDTSKRGVQAILLVGTPLVLSAWLLLPHWSANRRPIALQGGEVYRPYLPKPVFRNGEWYDPATGKQLDEDDPRFDFSKWADEVVKEEQEGSGRPAPKAKPKRR